MKEQLKEAATITMSDGWLVRSQWWPLSWHSRLFYLSAFNYLCTSCTVKNTGEIPSFPKRTITEKPYDKMSSKTAP